MARTQLHGSQQVLDYSIKVVDLEQNFFNGSDWNATNGSENATITGLKDGQNDSDVVVMRQYNYLLSKIEQAIILRGELVAPADLTGTSTGNSYIDAGNGYKAGDKFLITGSGDLTVSDGVVAVNTGDSITILNDVAANADITLADIYKTDNTESPDIVRTGDIRDNLTSTETDKPLSANQGRVLKNQVDAINSVRLEPVIGEALTGTVGSATLSDLVNTPYNGQVALYIGGQRLKEGSGNDYTISGKTITLEYNYWFNHNIVVDYNYSSPLTLPTA